MIDKKHIPTIGLIIGIAGFLLNYTTTIDLNGDLADTGFPIAFVFIFALSVCLFIYTKNLKEVHIKKKEESFSTHQSQSFKKPVVKNYMEQKPMKKETDDMFEGFK